MYLNLLLRRIVALEHQEENRLPLKSNESRARFAASEVLRLELQRSEAGSHVDVAELTRAGHSTCTSSLLSPERVLGAARASIQTAGPLALGLF